MKTSNKLISLGLVALIIIGISLLIAAKSSMVDKPYPPDNSLRGELDRKLASEGGKITQRSLGTLKTTKLDLDGNHRYILDPTTNEVTVNGPNAIVSQFEEIKEDDFFEAQLYTDITSKSDEQKDSKVFNRITDTLYYNIGIRDANSLLIFIGDESVVSASTPLQLDNLKIHLKGNSHLDAMLNCTSLDIKSSDNGHVRLEGNVIRVNMSLEDESRFECYGLSVQDTEILLSDNSRLELNSVSKLSGIIMDNAYYGNSDKINSDDLILRDNGRKDVK